MTQADLALAIADILGGDRTAHQSSISRWEKGKAEISMRFEIPLARALDVPAEILFEAPPDGWQPPAEQQAA